MQALNYELQVAAMTHISESDVAGANLVMLGSSVLQAELTLYSPPIQMDKKISNRPGLKPDISNSNS